MQPGLLSDIVPSDAHDSPYIEMCNPDRAFHYPLNEGSGTSATESISGNTGTYHGDYLWTSGPARPWNVEGKNGGWLNPNVFYSSSTNDGGWMTGPAPSASNENPAGITSYPFSLACWFKVKDGRTGFDASATNGVEDTTVTLVQVLHHGSSYTDGKLNARIELRRKRDQTAYNTNKRPGYYLHAVLQKQNLSEISATSEPTRTPYDAIIGDCGQFPDSTWDGGWHYVVATFNSSSVTLFIDGQSIKTTTVGVPAVMPSPPRFRAAINTNLREASPKHARHVQIAYASAYNTKVSEDLQMKHFLSMRRVMDLRVNYNSDKYTTARLDDTGDAATTDLNYSPTSRLAKHRHDNRWVHMIRIDNPAFGDSTGVDDDTESVAQFAIFRDYQLGTPTDAWNNWRIPLQSVAGGIRYGADRADWVDGQGVVMLAGWEGKHGPRDGSSVRSWTYLINMQGKGPGDADWTTATGVGSSAVTQDRQFQPDDKDGFALARVSDPSGWESHFEFFTPWGKNTVTYDSGEMVLGSDTTIIPSEEWRYQTIGCLSNTSEAFIRVTNPPVHRNNDAERLVAYTDFMEKVGDAYNDANPTAVTDCPRNQAPGRCSFLHTNRVVSTTTPGVYQLAGSNLIEDQGRYGPIALLPAGAISDGDVRRISRLMHGQALMRTRPALRSPFRNFQLTAPSRSLT